MTLRISAVFISLAFAAGAQASTPVGNIAAYLSSLKSK